MLAQSVEQGAFNSEVTGSNPVRPTILKHIRDRAVVVGLNKVGAALYDPLVCFNMVLARFVYRLGHPPFTQVRGVRFPYREIGRAHV